MYFNIMRLVSELVWDLGASAFAGCFSFYTDAAKDFLKGGDNIHKTIMWLLDVLWPAFYQACIREYIRYCISSGTNLATITFETFNVWLDRNEEDETFKSHVMLLRLVFPSLYSILAGLRNNNMVMYLSGCKNLSRYAFMLGKFNYGPAMLNEWSILFRCTEEVLDQRMKIFSPRGETFGLELEEKNRRVLRGRTGSTESQWLFSCFMEEATSGFRSNMYKILGLKERELEDRTPEDVSVDIEDMCIKFNEYKTWRKVRGRKEVFDFSNTEKLRSNCGAHQLYEEGNRRMSEYVKEFCNEEIKAVFPTRVHMTEAGARKAAEAKKKGMLTREINRNAKKAAAEAINSMEIDDANTKKEFENIIKNNNLLNEETYEDQ